MIFNNYASGGGFKPRGIETNYRASNNLIKGDFISLETPTNTPTSLNDFYYNHHWSEADFTKIDDNHIASFRVSGSSSYGYSNAVVITKNSDNTVSGSYVRLMTTSSQESTYRGHNNIIPINNGKYFTFVSGYSSASNYTTVAVCHILSYSNGSFIDESTNQLSLGTNMGIDARYVSSSGCVKIGNKIVLFQHFMNSESTSQFNSLYYAVLGIDNNNTLSVLRQSTLMSDVTDINLIRAVNDNSFFATISNNTQPATSYSSVGNTVHFTLDNDNVLHADFGVSGKYVYHNSQYLLVQNNYEQNKLGSLTRYSYNSTSATQLQSLNIQQYIKPNGIMYNQAVPCYNNGKFYIFWGDLNTDRYSVNMACVGIDENDLRIKGFLFTTPQIYSVGPSYDQIRESVAIPLNNDYVVNSHSLIFNVVPTVLNIKKSVNPSETFGVVSSDVATGNITKAISPLFT